MVFLYSAVLFAFLGLTSLFVLRSKLRVSRKVIGLGFLVSVLPLVLNLVYDSFVFSFFPSQSLGFNAELMSAFVNVLWFWSVALILMFKFKKEFKANVNRFAFSVSASSGFALLMSLFFFLPLVGGLFAGVGQAGFFGVDLVPVDAGILEGLVVDLSQVVRLIIIYFVDLLLLLLAFRFVFDDDFASLVSAVALDFTAAFAFHLNSSLFIRTSAPFLAWFGSVIVFAVFLLAVLFVWRLAPELDGVKEKLLA